MYHTRGIDEYTHKLEHKHIRAHIHTFTDFLCVIRYRMEVSTPTLLLGERRLAHSFAHMHTCMIVYASTHTHTPYSAIQSLLFGSFFFSKRREIVYKRRGGKICTQQMNQTLREEWSDQKIRTRR